MIGTVLDWVVLHTVKDGDEKVSGEQITTDYPVKHWVKYDYKPLKDQPTFRKVLDVGSFDVNGSFSTYDFFGRDQSWRSIVGNEEYTGIDLAEGAGVDSVMNAHEMTFKDNSFDLVICVEMLEHDDDPAQSIREIYRVLKPGAPLILTCPNEHTPEHHQGVSDHYTFVTKEKLTGWLKAAGFTVKEYQTNNDGAAHHLTYSVKEKK